MDKPETPSRSPWFLPPLVSTRYYLSIYISTISLSSIANIGRILELFKDHLFKHIIIYCISIIIVLITLLRRRHEWIVHGTCCPGNMHLEYNYFNTTLTLFEENFNFGNILSKAGIQPSNYYTVNIILHGIKNFDLSLHY